ncbi:MAG: hypothetical protein ACJ8H8_08940, partial [Geminicoccaceae bacterium]
MARQRTKPLGLESRPRRPAGAKTGRDGIRSVARARAWTARAATKTAARAAHVVSRTTRTTEAAAPGTTEAPARP